MNLSHLYLMHFLVSLICILGSKKQNGLKIFFVGAYLIFFLWFSRLFEFKQDLINYNNYAIWGVGNFREPVVLFINRISYLLFGEGFSFFLADTISVILICAIFKKLKVHYSYILIFFCFFPVIMGFQSIYRQFFGTLICLYIISFLYVDRLKYKNLQKVRLYLMSLVAILSHNVHILSVILISLYRYRWIFLVVISGFLSFAISQFYMSFGKANTNTGASTYFLYVLLLVVFFGVFNRFKDKLGRNISLAGIIIVLLTGFNGLETPSERMGLSFLIFIYLSIVLSVDRFKPRVVARATLLIFGFFPLYFFPAHSLITGSYL